MLLLPPLSPIDLEIFARISNPPPAGIAVSGKRVFVTFPRYGGDAVPFTLAELRRGKPVAYPDAASNDPSGPAGERLLSVQNAVVARDGTLWALDSGFRDQRQGIVPGGPKLVVIDLATNSVVRRIPLGDVAEPKSFLNDVRVDLTAGAAYITDAASEGSNAIVVVDLASNRARRRLEDHPSTKPVEGFLHVVEGKPLYQDGRPYRGGANSIALGAGGERLFYAPLSSRRLYSVPTSELRDASRSEEALGRLVMDHGDKGQSGGMTSDEPGGIYTTAQELNSILRWTPAALAPVVTGPQIVWPDTLDLADDGWMYLVCAQYNRRPALNEGRDLRKPPYLILRWRADARPVRR